jgi:hypothetical protein
MRTWIIILLVSPRSLAALSFSPIVQHRCHRQHTMTRGDIAHIVYASAWSRLQPAPMSPPLSRSASPAIATAKVKLLKPAIIIVELDDSETVARVRELEARVGLFNQQVERATNLLERGVGSREAFDRAASELASAEAPLAAQREVLAVIASPPRLRADFAP